MAKSPFEVVLGKSCCIAGLMGNSMFINIFELLKIMVMQYIMKQCIAGLASKYIPSTFYWTNILSKTKNYGLKLIKQTTGPLQH